MSPINQNGKVKLELDTDLFEGEALGKGEEDSDQNELNDRSANFTESSTPDSINEKYARGDLRIVTEQARYPLSTIVSLLESGNYQLDPEFQRRRRWDNARKSRLIESFIINIPIPPIFLYEKSYAQYEVMDGQQRMSAIFDFYKNEYALTDLQEWKELNGYKYEDLPEKIKAGIDRRYISSIILLQETAKDDLNAQRLKQLVFDRINSGGVQLQPQESRNAIYAGPLNQLCKDLAQSSTLQKLWFIPDETTDLDESSEVSISGIRYQDHESYKKMDDVELVLRFFAYRQLDKFPRSLPLSDILDEFLRRGNSFNESVLDNYRNLFNQTISLVDQVLDLKAFQIFRKTTRKNSAWVWNEKPLKVVYDPIMYAFSQRLTHAQDLINNRDHLQKKLEIFYQENSALFSGRKTTPTDHIRRMTETLNFITSFLIRA